MSKANVINEGATYIGIEFGSTRIKSVLIGDSFEVLASGSYQWENKLEGGYWSYDLKEILKGLRSSYASLKADVKATYGTVLRSARAIGISAMMHGYLAFDAEEKLLVPFRTWRNVTAARAAEELGKELNTHIPERWSIAHLYQAALDKEAHLDRLASVNTLAGYVHYLLTSKRVLGVGDASGMFPIKDGEYDRDRLALTEKLLRDAGYAFELKKLLPEVLSAGAEAGYLTETGAALLDEEGELEAGIPFCPPEGDAGTGMVATDSVRVGTGNVSAGTSIFAMIVLAENLSSFHREIDVVTTPDGSPVAMIHCNNCSGDIDAWFKLIKEATERISGPVSSDALYSGLLSVASETTAPEDIPISFNYLSGESITEVAVGAPMMIRKGGAELSLSGFVKSLLYSATATLRLGMDTLIKENVKINSVVAHGGFCKSRAGIEALSGALNTPVKTFTTAGEGGAYGMAVLAAYSRTGGNRSLADFLDNEVFATAETRETMASASTLKEFEIYLSKYKKFIESEKKAGALI